MRFILIAALVTIAAQLNAQDTVRNDTDYRVGSITGDSDKRASKSSHIYFGLQANQLLRQLLGGSGSSGNPFLITYGFNNKQTGGGLLLGLAYSTGKVVDKDLGLDRETKNSGLSVRFGYDKKVSIGKRWMAGGGFDVIFIKDKSNTKVSQGPETTTTTNGWGFGPRGTLLFHVNERIYLGTEMNWYYESKKNKTTIVFPGVSNQDSEDKETGFALQVPTAIFLTLRF
jgi:hypothetical protein